MSEKILIKSNSDQSMVALSHDVKWRAGPDVLPKMTSCHFPTATEKIYLK